ncbi:MAG: argininosuccinate synthase [Candidatus Aenigmarchaeota archaeon]|nr:argininosuccinate synthase [Candidatus Aenigmarchaeota archaeon]NCS71334.1 argininosuccinate synthase [Candidatus Aenigmarchaeota archaeon]PIW41758.1 MAG: argininosuccinate synthase [Candidatus Aenigmarchaeota archaeon CG15_BIG_FIL_POST_REV_8_21_14_020_37_27]PIY35332.1 MAG: argininosuccinate synthase [Candidatus Aenigmarchaeota archaeon CG_4_10_14_3_um_filter_37_21]PJB74402.1 MAG: argininosuccinate synthase [Candidatus Aenigmarchaeota archaeon CG_4_9_14_3_um_filter_37_18]
MGKNSKEKILLAFSGGLDTSFCIVYLKDQGYDVITATVDSGGFSKEELDEIKEKSKKLGAIEHHTIDGKKELFDNFISYTIKANALRGGVYPLSASCERYIQASKVVELALKKNIKKIAHGSTGAGNDQVRFHLSIKNFAPEIEIITPIRDLGTSRKEETEYLKKHGFEVPMKTSDYSINKGFMGNTIGGKETLGSWDSPPDDVYPESNSPEKAPDNPETLIIGFEKGIPISINDKKYDPLKILQKLAQIGNKHGIGRDIHLGATILGIKGRVAFEAPAAMILHKTHKELEKLILTKLQFFWKNHLGSVYGDLLHEGLYFDPVMRDIEKMIDSSQKFVCGDVKVKLYKGNIIVQGVKSPFSLMDKSIGTYGEKNILWDGKDAEGFCKIYGLEGIITNKIQKGDLK